jgi:hypothetical protein
MTEDDGLTPAQRLLRGEGTAIITAADLAKMSDTGEIPDSVREGVEGLMSKPAAKRPARKRAPAKAKAPTKGKATTPAKRAPRKRAEKAPTEKPDQPWDRQPGESNPAWEAFRIYRDMGATRSITKVAEQVHKNRQLMGRWSRTHTWPLRTIAFDKFNDREWQLTMREEADKANKRNAAIAAKIIKRVEAAVDFLAFEDAGELARAFDIATKIQARALGMSTENLQVTGKGGGPVEVADVTLLSDEDRRARLQQLMTEAQRRLDEQGREAEAS